MNESIIYFLEGRTINEKTIRIGHSFGVDKRLKSHMKYGLRPLAFVPSEQRHEGVLHAYFKPHLTGQDKSTYKYAAVFPYVRCLLEGGFAAPVLEESWQWSQADPRLWYPDKIEKPMPEYIQESLFFVEGAKSDIADTYETPDEVAEVCRHALGGNIDTDPCSTATANRRIRAGVFYNEKQNGLIRPWFGRVLLNPPYKGNTKIPAAAIFIEKLVKEAHLGNVTEAITILNLQSMPTLWFPMVWKNASAHAVWKKRIDFIRPRTESGAKPFSSSKNGTIFSYFGLSVSRFKKEFAHHAMVFDGDGGR